MHQEQSKKAELILDQPKELSIPAESLSVAQAGPAKRVKSQSLPRALGEFITTYSDEDEQGQVALSRAMCPADSRLDNYVGKTIRVAGAVLKMVELDDLKNPGQTVQRVYCSIVLDNGEVIGTCSPIPVDQMASLIRQREGKTGLAPAEYEVTQHPSKPPKQPYFSMRRVAAGTQAAKKGGGK